MITSNRQTEFPAYVSDYLPTFLDLLGMAHPHPSWAADGISLLPLIKQAAALPASVTHVIANRTKPLGFKLGKQVYIYIYIYIIYIYTSTIYTGMYIEY